MTAPFRHTVEGVIAGVGAIVVALLKARLFKKTLLKGETPMLIMELPPL